MKTVFRCVKRGKEWKELDRFTSPDNRDFRCLDIPKKLHELPTNLYNPGFVEDRVANRLEALHLPENFGHLRLLEVHQTERGHVHAVVLEVLEIERLDVLEAEFPA